MIYSIYPNRDATLYTDYPTQNTGLSEIIELSQYQYISSSIVTSSISRIVMQFDIDNIRENISNGTINTSPEYFLNLYITEEYQIPLNYTINVYPISESWEMGTGRRDNIPITTNGVSWTYRDGITAWSQSGGTYIDSFTGSVSMSYDIKDVRINVTNIVTQWISGNIDNNGFILIRNDESGSFTNSYIKFFSRDTHTVYPPKLEVCWDDSIYIAPSSSYATHSTTTTVFSRNNYDFTLSPRQLTFDSKTIIDTITPIIYTTQSYADASGIGYITSASIHYYVTTYDILPVNVNDAAIYIKNPQSNYNQHSKEIIRLNSRTKYPGLTFSTSSGYYEIRYLPTSSYYSIVDARTNDPIIPFDDNYTKFSLDSNGHFFNIWFDSLQPERWYKFVFKIVDNEIEKYFDNNYIFKVKRY